MPDTRFEHALKVMNVLLNDFLFWNTLLYGLLERWSCQPREWQPLAEDQLTNPLFPLLLAQTLKPKQKQLINHRSHIIQ